mmetsp:Transcript_110512/g.336132  ORF Transcript_110512/g.336132 Transcript_110512/m.336132 type:complete len:270 (+) Transcript_110512:224-1033(+)
MAPAPLPRRWSTTSSRWKLYVRIFSERSPVPRCSFRMLCSRSLRAARRWPSSRVRSISSARARFSSCEGDVAQCTVRPEARCVARMAWCAAFTLWPPGPEDFLLTSRRTSLGASTRSSSRATGSTTTTALEVCMRPLRSVAGMRCTRWPPDSQRSQPKAPSPPPPTLALAACTEPKGPSVSCSSSKLQPRASAKRSYIWSISPVKSAASRPPTPGVSSSTASRPSTAASSPGPPTPPASTRASSSSSSSSSRRRAPAASRASAAASSPS